MPETAQAPRQAPTLKQERLAAVLLDTENPPDSKADALRRAGYSAVTAYASAARSLESAGTQRAIESRQSRRLDKARGLKSLGEAALAKPGLIDELDARDRLAFGMQALKTASELGVEPESGDADAFREWRKGFMRRRFARLYRMHTLGIGPLGWRKPVESQLDAAHNAGVIDVTASSDEA